MVGIRNLATLQSSSADSYSPLKMSSSHVTQVIKILEDCFGSSLNSMGFKLLPSYLRIIQGDGMDLGSVDEVRNALGARRV